MNSQSKPGYEISSSLVKKKKKRKGIEVKRKNFNYAMKRLHLVIHNVWSGQNEFKWIFSFESRKHFSYHIQCIIIHNNLILLHFIKSI